MGVGKKWDIVIPSQKYIQTIDRPPRYHATISVKVTPCEQKLCQYFVTYFQ
jgi:hypothetical protein